MDYFFKILCVLISRKFLQSVLTQNLINIETVNMTKEDSFRSKKMVWEPQAKSETKYLFFDSQDRPCLSDNCIPHQNYIDFYELFKYDDGNPQGLYICNNIILSNKQIPDISFDNVIKPSFEFDLWKQKLNNDSEESVLQDVIFHNRSFKAYKSKNDYFSYGAFNGVFTPLSFSDLIKKDSNSQFIWKFQNQKQFETGYKRCRGENISRYEIDTYLVDKNTDQLNYGNIDKSLGVFGLAPKSNVWKYVKNLHHDNLAKRMMISIHYQNESPDNDHQKKYATGKYLRPSTLSINGNFGEQTMSYHDSASEDYWLQKDAKTIWFSSNTSTNNRLLATGLETSNTTQVNQTVCFANNEDNFIYVNEAEQLIDLIQKSACGEIGCQSKDIDMEKNILTLNIGNDDFTFKVKHLVSLNLDTSNLVYWVGNLNTLLENKICPPEANIAFGKRFLRYIEMSMSMNLEFKEQKVGLGLYVKSDFYLVLYYGCFVIGQFITVVYLLVLIKTIIKKKTNTKHVDINFTDNLIQESNQVSLENPKKEVQCKIVINYHETRIDVIHKAKFIYFTPYMLILVLGALITVHEFPTFYIGILVVMFYLLVNFTVVLQSSIDLVKKTWNFTDPHHAHYFILNISKSVIKIWFLLFMVIDMVYAPKDGHSLIVFAYTPFIFMYFFWSFVVYYKRYSCKVMILYLLRDVIEDGLAIIQWLHYQRSIPSYVVVAIVEVFLLTFWVDFYCFRSKNFEFNHSCYTHNGKPINVLLFRLSCQISTFIYMILILIGGYLSFNSNTMYAFTTISVILIVTVSFCCVASFLDNSICFFSIWRKKFWFVTGAFLESCDFNKEWYLNFKPAEKKFILKKPSVKNALSLINRGGCQSERNKIAPNQEKFNPFKKGKDIDSLKRPRRSREFSKLSQHTLQTYLTTDCGNIFNTTNSDNKNDYIKEPIKIKEKEFYQLFDKIMPIGLYEPERNITIMTEKIACIDHKIDNSFKMIIFDIKTKKKLTEFKNLAGEDYKITLLNGDYSNRFMYLIRPNSKSGNSKNETVLLFDRFTNVKHHRYIFQSPFTYEDDQFYEEEPLRHEQFIYYFEEKRYLLSASTQNNKLKLRMFKVSGSELELVKDDLPEVDISDSDQDFKNNLLEFENYISLIFVGKGFISIIMFDYNGNLKTSQIVKDQIINKGKICNLIRDGHFQFKALDKKGNYVCDIYYGIKKEIIIL